MLFNRFKDWHPRVGCFKINRFLADIQRGCAMGIDSNFLEEGFGRFHHPVIVFVGDIKLHNRKLRIVRSVHPFVSKVFGKLINTIETADNQTFEVQLVGDTQVERNVQCIVMGDKWTRCGSTRNRLKDWRFHFQIALIIKKRPNGIGDFGTLKKSVFYLWVHNQVNIAHAIALLRIRK